MIEHTDKDLENIAFLVDSSDKAFDDKFYSIFDKVSLSF